MECRVVARLHTFKMRGIVTTADRCLRHDEREGRQALGVYAPAIAPVRINEIFSSPSNHGSFNDGRRL